MRCGCVVPEGPLLGIGGEANYGKCGICNSKNQEVLEYGVIANVEDLRK
jgi:hypothetical protein